MNSKLDPGFLPLILVSLVVLGIPSCVCQDDQLYQNCSRPFQCGGFTQGYPFWGGNRPPSCGYPGFELDCQGGVPLLTTSSITYRVLDIDNQMQTLRVSRNDTWDDLCPGSPLNTTLDSNLFNYYAPANDQSITLYYGCTFSGQPPPSLFSFNCTARSPNSFNLFTVRDASGQVDGINGTCNTQVSVPVNETSAQNLALNSLDTTARLQAALQGGFTIQWSADNQTCENCVQSGGLCGSNRDSFACHCTNGNFESTCNGTSSGNDGNGGGNSNLGLNIGVPIAGAVLAGVGLGWLIFYFRQQIKYSRKQRLQCLGIQSTQTANDQNVDKFLLNQGSLAPKRYSYNEIKKITKSFTDKLGQGGYGIVYKGKLPDGQLVAVKVLTETHDNTEEFINEVVSISRTSHVNIVNLLGFCHNRRKRALVYEFMPNKSLDKFIYRGGSVNPECSLEWEKLYKIAVGVARGLEYLHRGCNTRIVHFDIKPQNILLDEDFWPKISDFGLAKLFKKKQSIISMVGARGTIGYIAPEVFCRNFGVVSHKSDVYSYGMMLLDIVEARKIAEIGVIQSSENYFPDNIYEHIVLNNNRLDDLITGEREETVRKMLLVGFWCFQTAPTDRPSMTKVVEMLEGSLQSIQIPPKPFLSSPNMLGTQFSSSFSVDVEVENLTEG